VEYSFGLVRSTSFARCFPPFGIRRHLDALYTGAELKGPPKAERERARLRFSFVSSAGEDTRCPCSLFSTAVVADGRPNSSDAREREAPKMPSLSGALLPF
jgi:hypothetical protein